MEERLRAIRRNLAALEVLRDFRKLRVVQSDAEEPLDSGTPVGTATHHLAIEDRYVLQGVQRMISGDGHRLTIAFIRLVIDDIEALADDAFRAHHSPPATPAGDGATVAPAADAGLFRMKPAEVLQELATAVHASLKGLELLKHTTYGESDQIGVWLTELMARMTTIRDRVNGFLRAQ